MLKGRLVLSDIICIINIVIEIILEYFRKKYWLLRQLIWLSKSAAFVMILLHKNANTGLKRGRGLVAIFTMF